MNLYIQLRRFQRSLKQNVESASWIPLAVYDKVWEENDDLIHYFQGEFRGNIEDPVLAGLENEISHEMRSKIKSGCGHKVFLVKISERFKTDSDRHSQLH